MVTKLIKGLSQIQSQYDAFLIDLWGVVHNGVQLYPSAIDVLKNLNALNKRFVLLSNAPRPSKSVEKYLLNLKMDKVFLKNVPSESGYLAKLLATFRYSFFDFGLGPRADSLADSFILANLLLNKLIPATYFSATILFGLGNVILLKYYLNCYSLSIGLYLI